MIDEENILKLTEEVQLINRELRFLRYFFDRVLSDKLLDEGIIYQISMDFKDIKGYLPIGYEVD